MSDDWEDRVAAFWATADDQQPARLLSEMRSLASDLPANDPAARHELASVHDFVGHEEDAVPLYRAALEQGLSGTRRTQAIIQLASSLRNIGEPAAAVELLQPLNSDDVTGDAAQAFLALAQWDRGQPAAALRTALTALSRSLPLYQRRRGVCRGAVRAPRARHLTAGGQRTAGRFFSRLGGRTGPISLCRVTQ